jgi:hypothetical protein
MGEHDGGPLAEHVVGDLAPCDPDTTAQLPVVVGVSNGNSHAILL